MQQLKYVKPNGSPDNPNDCVDLKFAEPYILSTISGVSGLEKTIVSSEIAGVDGVAVHHIRTEPRIIPVTAYVYGKTQEEMYKHRFELIAALSNTKQAGKLYYSNDHITAVIDAYPQIPANFTKRIKTYNECDIQFFCPYPYWSDTAQKSSQLQFFVDKNAFSFPLVFQDTICFAESSTSITIDYNGSVPTPVTIILVGEVLSPIIENETIGERIEVADVSLSAGDSLTICTQKGKKSVTLYKDGITSDAFQLVTPASTFWELQPGKNVIKFYSNKGMTGSSMVITYCNLYEGV